MLTTTPAPKNNDPRSRDDSCSVPREMLVEHRLYLKPGQTITIYGQVATEGAPPKSGLVVGDTITVVAVEPVRPGLALRRLNFRGSS